MKASKISSLVQLGRRFSVAAAALVILGAVACGRASTTTSQSRPPVPAVAASTTQTAMEPPSTEAPQVVVVLRSGQFRRVAHAVSGGARLVRLSDGSAAAELSEDFQVDSGPDLHVVLSTVAGARNGRELGSYIVLGELRSTSGAQRYAIPAEVDLSQILAVAVHCIRFNSLFAVAEVVEMPAEQ
ncbi:MAG: DM13 domain-containing protein [Deinococcus sp.]|nr:DM13 domain-containing protein [Deinococcus sp.]